VSATAAHRARRTDAGVTLLELLAAVAILGVIAGVLYGTFTRTLLGRDRASESLERYAAARAVLDWLGRDLEGSFSTGLFPGGGKRFYAGEEAKPGEPTLGRAALLDVTTTSARSVTPLTGPVVPDLEIDDAGDQVRVLYHLEKPAAEDGQGLDFVRYEHRPPLRTELEEAARVVIAHGVAAVELRFFDGASWHEEWDSLASGARQRGYAPRVVEARVRMTAPGGEPVELVSAFYVTLGGRRSD
jgi:prepilin-type N-terminal cleavage/methylation domain-containing protein